MIIIWKEFVAFVFGAIRLYLAAWCTPGALAKREEEEKRNMVCEYLRAGHSLFVFQQSNTIGKQSRMKMVKNTSKVLRDHRTHSHSFCYQNHYCLTNRCKYNLYINVHLTAPSFVIQGQVPQMTLIQKE